MFDLNRIFILGRLGTDPEKRVSRNGKDYTVMKVATSRPQKSPEAPATTDWHTVTVWGNQSTACFEYLKKGQPVLVEGSVNQFKIDSEAGEPKYFQQIKAQNVHFLGPSASRPGDSPLT